MITKREVIVFFAGADAFHTFSHIIMSVSGSLPMQIFGFTLTPSINVGAISVNASVTAGLLFWATMLKMKQMRTRAAI